jgi:hypothetical protein
MKRYVLANIKIPILVNENGLFDMLNEYTQTEITMLNELPTIEGEDNLYKKIIEFLENPPDNLDEPVQKIKIKDWFEDNANCSVEDSVEDSEESSEQHFKESVGCGATEESSLESSADEICKTTMEQVMTICKNNIKMRKHSNNITFKNIKKGVKSYTQKNYQKS